MIGSVCQVVSQLVGDIHEPCCGPMVGDQPRGRAKASVVSNDAIDRTLQIEKRELPLGVARTAQIGQPSSPRALDAADTRAETSQLTHDDLQIEPLICVQA